MDLNSFFMTAPVHPDVIEQSLWMIIALPLLGACGVTMLFVSECSSAINESLAPPSRSEE